MYTLKCALIASERGAVFVPNRLCVTSSAASCTVGNTNARCSGSPTTKSIETTHHVFKTFGNEIDRKIKTKPREYCVIRTRTK